MNKTQSISNPMPLIFATSLLLVFIGVLIAISQFGRVSSTAYTPSEPHSTLTANPDTPNTYTSPVRAKTNILIVGVGAVTLTTILLCAMAALLLNKRHARHLQRIETSLALTKAGQWQARYHSTKLILNARAKHSARNYGNWS